ncbi:MAG: M20/M25/M40 family metallo-hydrolase, partial [Thermoplasmata archaeon]
SANSVKLSVQNLKKDKDIDIEIKNLSEPNYTLPSAEIIKTFKNIAKKYDILLDTTFQWASSDARYFRYRNIPTIQYGPATLEGIHSYNERVRISDILTSYKIYNNVLNKILLDLNPTLSNSK